MHKPVQAQSMLALLLFEVIERPQGQIFQKFIKRWCSSNYQVYRHLGL